MFSCHHSVHWLRTMASPSHVMAETGPSFSLTQTYAHTHSHTPCSTTRMPKQSCQNSGDSRSQLPAFTEWQLGWVSSLLQSLNMPACCFWFKEAMGWKEKISVWISPNIHLCSGTVQEHGPWRRMWDTRNAVGNTCRKLFIPDIVTQLLATKFRDALSLGKLLGHFYDYSYNHRIIWVAKKTFKIVEFNCKPNAAKSTPISCP